MIAEFYENCEIFITGGSGVVGKAAIEKLLRSCNVKRIYVLLRAKKGVSPKDRLMDLKKSKIFRVLRESQPKELDKLVPISGNVTDDGLGISPEDRELIKNVSVFFHSAATTRFNEPIKNAIRTNIKSTLEALKIAETMQKLKIFVHISTYFCNPSKTYIEDKLYKPEFDWRTALKMLESDSLDDDALNIVTDKFINEFQNTYLITKHMTEHMVNDYRHKVPVAIYKPSIVISALNEPEQGFSESITGFMALTVIWNSGLMQVFSIPNDNIVMDVTPLDTGTKTLLMFTAMRGQLTREKLMESTPIGKFSSINVLHDPIKKYSVRLTKAAYEYPLEKSLWIPHVTTTQCKYYAWILLVLLQLLPSMIIDTILKMMGKKTFLMDIQRRAYITQSALSFFLTNQYYSDGPTDLDEMVRLGRGTEFSLDDFVAYKGDENGQCQLVKNVALGCRRYLLDEPDSSIEQCRKILRGKKFAYNVFRFFVLFVVVRAAVRYLVNYFM